jgi:hypothetical protein
MAQPVTGVRPLHLDDIGAETGQQAGGIRPGYLLGQVDDLDATQQSIRCHYDPPLPAMLMLTIVVITTIVDTKSRCQEQEGTAWSLTMSPSG